MTGNQYLWGNNPYSEYKMVNIKTMKTLYDPCPAGYKVSPPDVYGAFLKEKIIEGSVTDRLPSSDYHYGTMDGEKFYPPSFTKYGAYFYCGEGSMQRVYFTGNVRFGDTGFKGFQGMYYGGSLAGTLLHDDGNGGNDVVSFAFNIPSSFGFGCSFGSKEAHYWLDRSAAASIRCVRDE